MDRQYATYAAEQAAKLLEVDSPTGFTDRAADWVLQAFRDLGFSARMTGKGGVLIDLGGRNADDALLLEAHADTLGAMVAEVKSTGRLRITPLGGLNANNAETENVRVYTRDGKVLEGTCQLCNASIHVNGEYASTNRTFDTVEVVLDDQADSAEEAAALGVQVGDVVCLEPRTRITRTGYIKSRFLDDKLSVGILLGLAKYLADGGVTPERRVYIHVTVYEEVGHGGSASVPEGVTEVISVATGCVGDGRQGASGVHLRQGFRRPLLLPGGGQADRGGQGGGRRLRRGCVSPVRQRRGGDLKRRLRRPARPHRPRRVRLPRL